MYTIANNNDRWRSARLSSVHSATRELATAPTSARIFCTAIRSGSRLSSSSLAAWMGKGKRPTPERQIYKTGKACPAHMIVTETLDRVLVTFYKTHVGHGTCPYYEPREPKPAKCEQLEMDAPQLICDACGVGFLNVDKFKTHVASHGLKLYPCEHCDDLFQNVDAWTRHVRIEHDDSNL
ncbi:unnamed protein product [Parnassius apollo]|uniref:(apollo) hypothetical protein n=1 Tax=Parnassius apollo TaxID=110799 RepID=A0A8S3XTK2_PARAO|nr:unnamed protein product [Parnassius apollo]